MPFLRCSVEAYDELMSELDPADLPPGLAENRPSGEFEYEAASARFTPEELGPVSRVVLEVLVSAGATGFRVRYDGGHDEGFAYPEAILFGAASRPAAAAFQAVATGDVITRIREAGARSERWWNAAEMFAEASAAEAATYALDELAGELATRLLGEGFGTGEYELYGAFTADFKSGEIRDDPNAVQPEPWE